jgi:hypothetical protein
LACSLTMKMDSTLPKHQLAFNGLHTIACQKILLFITTLWPESTSELYQLTFSGLHTIVCQKILLFVTTLWPESASELYRPSYSHLSAKLVPALWTGEHHKMFLINKPIFCHVPPSHTFIFFYSCSLVLLSLSHSHITITVDHFLL